MSTIVCSNYVSDMLVLNGMHHPSVFVCVPCIASLTLGACARVTVVGLSVMLSLARAKSRSLESTNDAKTGEQSVFREIHKNHELRTP